MLEENQQDQDWRRRFGGLSRLYGTTGLTAIQQAHIAVIGLGGVGSWAVEALARCGVGQLTLVDFDHIAESNVNRQIHALTSSLGQSKGLALVQRVLDINSSCHVNVIDDFLTPDNVSDILHPSVDVILDCTDQVSAKIAMILHARTHKIKLLVCGGAGGKTDPLSLRYGDLSACTHDALLNKVRQQLRREHAYPKVDPSKKSKRIPKMGVDVLWFEQVALLPSEWNKAQPLQGLACAGYGSVVTVTATMGMVAADKALVKIVNQSV